MYVARRPDLNGLLKASVSRRTFVGPIPGSRLSCSGVALAMFAKD